MPVLPVSAEVILSSGNTCSSGVDVTCPHDVKTTHGTPAAPVVDSKPDEEENLPLNPEAANPAREVADDADFADMPALVPADAAEHAVIEPASPTPTKPAAKKRAPMTWVWNENPVNPDVDKAKAFKEAASKTELENAEMEKRRDRFADEVVDPNDENAASKVFRARLKADTALSEFKYTATANTIFTTESGGKLILGGEDALSFAVKADVSFVVSVVTKLNNIVSCPIKSAIQARIDAYRSQLILDLNDKSKKDSVDLTRVSSEEVVFLQIGDVEYRFQHAHISVDDSPSAAVRLRKAIVDEGVAEQIALRLKAGEKVFIHCQAGISRSATVVTYVLREYFMTDKSITDIINHVKSSRPIIKLNDGFLDMLNTAFAVAEEEKAEADPTP